MTDKISLPSYGRRRALQEVTYQAELPSGDTAQGQVDEWSNTLGKIWRRRALIAGFMLGFGLIAIVGVSSIPSYYTAEARVLIGLPTPKMVSVESILADVSPDAERVQNESFVLQSRDLAKQVIARLHLVDDPEFNFTLRPASSWKANVIEPISHGFGSISAWLSARKYKADAATPTTNQIEDRMVDVLLARVDVSTLGRSHVLSLQASAETPDKAAAIANMLANTYLDDQRESKVEATAKVERFLQSRIDVLRRQVEKSEQVVEQYRQANGLYMGEHNGVVSQQLTEFNSQLIVAQTAKTQAQSLMHEAESARTARFDVDSVPDVLRSPLIQALKQQQAEAEGHLAAMVVSFGDRHPEVIAAKAQVADIKRKLQLEIGRTVDGLRREARTAEARYSTLVGNFERLKGQMGLTNDKQIHLDALQRDAAVDRNLLETMLHGSKQTIGQQEIQEADAKLISTAAAPVAPAYPPKTLIVVLGTFGGFLLGVIASLSLDGIDPTFRRSDEIEGATGLDVIAMVPELVNPLPAIAQVVRNRTSAFNDALRKAYVSLSVGEDHSPVRLVLVTSATPLEGKSVFATSLSRLLALDGKRILLIDCDWRMPSTHEIFGCPNTGGLASLLGDERVLPRDVIHQDSVSGLDIIFSGTWNQSAHRLFASERMRTLLEGFACSYDLVILDAPPILAGAEVLSLSRVVDRVFFAVRWGFTRRDSVLAGLRQMRTASNNIAGIICTRVDIKKYRKYATGPLDYTYGRSIDVTAA